MTDAELAAVPLRPRVAGRFVTATAERLADRSRPLDDATWLVIFVDGFDFASVTRWLEERLGSAASNRS
ncbi:MAG: hypothetical protein KY447_07380 [Actinobacteria bacterium]|nr:hypothetical protein [Actinomycetota bacterium]